MDRLRESLAFFDDSKPSYQGEHLKGCQNVLEVALEELGRPSHEWRQSLKPWDRLVETLRNEFGDTWASVSLALTAVGESDVDDCPPADLMDHEASLCRRFQWALSMADHTGWWINQSQAIHTDYEAGLFAIAATVLTSGSILSHLAPTIGQCLDRLSQSSWDEVIHCISSARYSDLPEDFHEHLPANLSSRTVALLCRRMTGTRLMSTYLEHLQNFDGSDLTVWNTIHKAASLEAYGAQRISESLAQLQKAYSHGATMIKLPPSEKMPVAVAEKILQTPERYSRVLVHAADEAYLHHISQTSPVVGDTAHREQWFEND